MQFRLSLVVPNATINRALRALQAGPADRDTSLVSRNYRRLLLSFWSFGIPVFQPLDRNVCALVIGCVVVCCFCCVLYHHNLSIECSSSRQVAHGARPRAARPRHEAATAASPTIPGVRGDGPDRLGGRGQDGNSVWRVRTTYAIFSKGAHERDVRARSEANLP